MIRHHPPQHRIPISYRYSSNDNSDYELDDSATYYSPTSLKEKRIPTLSITPTEVAVKVNKFFLDEATGPIREGGQGASTYKLMAGGQDGPPDGGSVGTGKISYYC
jgi:hypothetical protein